MALFLRHDLIILLSIDRSYSAHGQGEDGGGGKNLGESKKNAQKLEFELLGARFSFLIITPYSGQSL